MKKILLFTVIFCAILLSGCPKNAETPQKTTVTVETNANTHVYLAKINNSSSKTIKANNTGYVDSTKNRSITEENDISFSSAKFHDDNFIRQQNQFIKESLSQDFSRSASNDKYNSLVTNKNDLNYELNDTETFKSFNDYKLINQGKSNEYKEGVCGTVTAKCFYIGKYCYVFGDISDMPDENNPEGKKSEKGIKLNYSSDETQNSFVLLGKNFDDYYELETAIIGNPVYNTYRENIFVPCTDKIVILVSDLYGDASYNPEIVGYFYNADLYKQDFLDEKVNLEFVSGKYQTKQTSDPSYIFSNQKEMFYIDSQFLTTFTDGVYSTLVHEFNHMINFVIKTLNYMTNSSINVNSMANHMCDTWFTEMLAMTTEDMFYDYLKIQYDDSPWSRLPIFNNYYHYGFLNWDFENTTVTENPKLAYQYVAYANTYAFGAYLARNFGGTELIKEIAQNEYINIQAVTTALQKINGPEIDFNYALKQFPNTLILTDKPNAEQLAKTGDEQYYSLNRTVRNNNDKLFFKAIDLANDVGYKNENDKFIPYPPYYYNSKKKIDLGPNGFSLHYLGYNLKSFELNASTSSYIDYYLIETN